MKTAGTFWKLTALVLAMLTLGLALPASAAGPVSPTPIPPQPNALPVPEFIGHAAAPYTIQSLAVPPNPYMAPGSWSAPHDDTYMSDTYTTPGPLGKAPMTVVSSYLAVQNDNDQTIIGIGGGTTVDSAGRLVISVIRQNQATGESWAQLTLMDPDTLDTLATLDLPSKVIPFGARPAGIYLYQDEQYRTVIGTPNRTVWVVSHACNPTCSFTPVNNNSDPNDPDHWAYNLNVKPGANIGIPADDDIQALQPDFAGRLWFTSDNGVVGDLDMQTGQMLGSIYLPGERIVNGSAADETGGVYVATTRAMYRFDADVNGAPVISWQEPYDAGTRVKPGQVDIGTGTTPTLMGKDYVTITDNADPQMHVVVWRRAKHLHEPRLVCEVPVFKRYLGSNENSLVGTDRSIIVENNYGYVNPTTTTNGATTEPGLARIDINDDGQGCHTEWTTTKVSIPSVVTKLSLKTGLIYTYSKPKEPKGTDAWYFTAIDFETGRVVYKQLAGTGAGFDNDYAAITIGPDGAAYVGVLGGIVALRDRQ